MDPNLMMMLLPLISGAMGTMGTKDPYKVSNLNEGQQSLMDQLRSQIQGMGGAPNIEQNKNYQTGQNWLQSMFSDPEFFKNFEAPLQRQFEEQTVPDLANRFAGMGSGGALGSTAFRNQLAREGSNLHTNIAALRGGMQQQAMPQLLGYAQQPFQNYMTQFGAATNPQENAWMGPQQGFGQLINSIISAGASGFGQGAGQSMAGIGQGNNQQLQRKVGFA